MQKPDSTCRQGRETNQHPVELASQPDSLHCSSESVSPLSHGGRCIGSSISSKIPVISGITQESVSGPILFLIYINDVVDVCSDLSVSLSLFADDLKLYVCYKVDMLHAAVNRLTDGKLHIRRSGIQKRNEITPSICMIK